MEPVTSRIPMMVVEGNHEIEEQIDNKTFASYSSRFSFPSTESGSFSPFYYSFDAGGIHFIMLAAYADYNKSGIHSIQHLNIPPCCSNNDISPHAMKTSF